MTVINVGELFLTTKLIVVGRPLLHRFLVFLGGGGGGGGAGAVGRGWGGGGGEGPGSP